MHPLPTSVQAVARIVGETHALTLAGIARNRQLYVPRSASDSHPIVQAIGRASYAQLSREFGGELIPLARCRPSQRGAMRVRSIKAALMAGVPAHEVALRFGVTSRRVHQIADMALSRPDRTPHGMA